MEAAEIEKELADLEHKAEHLRALYEQYFMGIDRVEPLVPRKDVERRIIVLRREQLRNTAQRFKFNTLVQRFNTMQTHWSRIVREIENGTYRRDVIRAAARFGDGALAALGKKKTKDLVAAVARAQSKVKVDDSLELGADDLIEDDDEDEAPTPPKLPVAAELPRPPVSGLGQGDLPVVGFPVATPSVAAGPRPPGAVGPLPQPALPPQRSGGLRWGGAAPSEPGGAVRAPAGETKKRVAELAAQLGPQRPAQPRGGFGELDLDFEDSPAVGETSKPSAQPARPLPVVTAPPPRAPAPQPAPSGFGVLDVPLEGDPLPTPSPAISPSPAGAGIRSTAQPRPVAKPAPAPPAATRPAATPSDTELPDQRIRQIYAKYVETKRATQESTAGVTFEKLAASLRAQATKLKSAHPNRSIDYEVVVKDGKTHLKPVLR
jgi:hypothetical protein